MSLKNSYKEYHQIIEMSQLRNHKQRTLILIKMNIGDLKKKRKMKNFKQKTQSFRMIINLVNQKMKSLRIEVYLKYLIHLSFNNRIL
jgi:hypothetical protein